MDYVVRTEVFEGPFDLLLHLIARQRVDLWQVSVSRITEDYLAEVKRMHELNLEVATEFLVVAATLLELKAARLLPGPDADPDEVEALLSERDLLFARVLQYRAYKHVAALFAARLAQQAGYVPGRAGADTDDLFGRIVPDLLVGTSPEELARLAAAALTPVPVPEVRTSHIAPLKLSVNEAVTELAGRVRAAGSTTFAELVGSGAMPIEVVVHFLALLELYKRSMVEVEQAAAFGAIAVQWTGQDDPALTDLAVEEPA